MNEELDPKTAEIVNMLAIASIKTIQSHIPKDTIYTEMNLVLNVVTGSLAMLMGNVPSELRESFIATVTHTLKINREHFWRNGV